MLEQRKPTPPLYAPSFEHDNCGIGAIVNIDGTKDYATVDNALAIVERLEHRAGKDAAGETGDGVGILLQVPHAFFHEIMAEQGIELGGERDYGVGMFFLPQDELPRNQAKKMLGDHLRQKGRYPACLASGSHRSPMCWAKRRWTACPALCRRSLVVPPTCEKGLDFDRKLYVIRREFEQSNEDTYVCSLSSRTIVYKGMFLVEQLRQFYLDLQDARIMNPPSPWCIPGSPPTPTPPGSAPIPTASLSTTARSTPSRAMRTGCWHGRKPCETSASREDDLDKVFPVINTAGSDSAMLDNTLEFLVMSGMDLPHSRDDYHSGALGQQPCHEPEAEGFLPVLRHHDGALGRSCLHSVL